MTAYRLATRYCLLALARHRLAMVVLVAFIPVAITLPYQVIFHGLVTFRYRATGQLIRATGDRITTIGCAVNSVTMLVGFAMFTGARRARDFHHRLVSAGFPRLSLLLASLTSLIVASAVVGAYATAWIQWYWPVRQPVLMWAGVLSAGLVYGAIGLFLALFLPGDLEGMFVIIMTTLIDNVLQNPMVNPESGARAISALPAYGAMQVSLGAGFTGVVPVRYFALSAAWTVGFAAIAFGAFVLRTRDRTGGRDLAAAAAL